MQAASYRTNCPDGSMESLRVYIGLGIRHCVNGVPNIYIKTSLTPYLKHITPTHKMVDNILILGATRGLGASLRTLYSAKPGTHVFATSRSSNPEPSSGVTWLTGIDISQPDVGQKLVSQLPSTKLSTVIISAGYFGFETFDSPDWEKEVQMYTTSAIGPVFVVHNLVKAGLLDQGSKVILVSSESGSITLRHEKEGGGNFGHHASKAALNMVGKLLSLDLKPKGIAVGLVHPGFMRTEMTKSVGFDKYWDAGGGE